MSPGAEMAKENRCGAALASTKQEALWKSKLDGGSSWWVVFGSFMIQFVVVGLHNGYGSLYVELLREFNGDSKATIAWIGSLSFGLVLFTGPLTTALCVRIGCRAVTVLGALMIGLGLFLSSYVTASYQLFFTYSVLFGVGSSCCYFTSVLILSEYFSKKLVFANGIALAGSGVGTLVLALFTNYLMETFQWRDTLRILSATAVVILLVGWIYRAVPAPFVPNESTEPQKMFNMALFKNQAYLIWIISLGLVQFGFYIPYVHLVQHGQDLGIPRAKCVTLVGTLAISVTVGKIAYGRLSDSPRVNRLYLYQMSLLVCSVMTTLLPTLVSFGSLLAYSIIFGLHDGCFVVHVAILTGDIAGKKNLVPAFGLLFLFSSPPMMLGPPVAGWVYERIHSYEPAFYMSGALTVLAVCLLFLVPFFIPPHVEQEWNERSVQKVAFDSENASEDFGREKRPLASEYSVVKGRPQSCDNLSRNDVDRKTTFMSSMENILDRYFSMPKEVALEDCVSRKLLVNSMENHWDVLDSCRETCV